MESLPVIFVIKMKQFHLGSSLNVQWQRWCGVLLDIVLVLTTYQGTLRNAGFGLRSNWLPNRSKVHTFEIALICWAIWKT